MAPISTYVYDALYRLKEAEGREKSGLNEERHSPYTELYHRAIKANRNDATAVQKYKRLYSYDKGNNLTRIEQTQGNNFTRKIVISESSNRGVMELILSQIPVRWRISLISMEI